MIKAEMHCIKIASRVPDVSDFYEKCMSRMLGSKSLQENKFS